MIPNPDYRMHKNADNYHQNYILWQAGKRKTKLQTKLPRLNSRSKQVSELTELSTCSAPTQLPTAEHNVLHKGLSYNIEDADHLEIFVVLEEVFKTTWLATDSRKHKAPNHITDWKNTELEPVQSRAVFKNLKKVQTMIILISKLKPQLT